MELVFKFGELEFTKWFRRPLLTGEYIVHEGESYIIDQHTGADSYAIKPI